MGDDESAVTGDMSRQTGSEPVSYSELYEKYDINTSYRHPTSYGTAESYYGNGKYPPDWGANRDDISDSVGGRKEAIYEYQDGRCARCNRGLDEYGYHCHHYLPLSEQGTNELENLVGLCEDCHHLIHPNNSQLSGDWRDAPLFPHSDADRRVATVRTADHPLEERQFGIDLRLLEATSSPGENANSTSEATYSLSATDALTAQGSLDQLLQNRGLAPDGTAVVRVTDEHGSPVDGQSVELKLYFDDHDPVLLEQETDMRGRVETALPAHTAGYARVYTDGQTVDTELTETADGWTATLEFPSETSAPPAGNSRSPADSASSAGNSGSPADSASSAGNSGSTAGSESSGDRFGDDIMEIVIGAVVAPFYLLYVGVKYIVYLIIAIVLLNLVFAVPLGTLSFLWDFWSGNPYGFGSGVRYLISFGLIAFVVSWSVFWAMLWEKADP